MQCVGLQDHSDPAPSRGPDHIRLAYQQFKVWKLTWGDLLTQFLQHYFSLSFSTRMGTSWLNLSILLLTFTFYREGDQLTLTCNSHHGNPLPTLKWYKQGEYIPTQVRNRTKKNKVTKILSSRRFLWSLTRTVWQSWPSQWTGETMTWCIVVRWVMASTFCLLLIAFWHGV